MPRVSSPKWPAFSINSGIQEAPIEMPVGKAGRRFDFPSYLRVTGADAMRTVCHLDGNAKPFDGDCVPNISPGQGDTFSLSVILLINC
jgi:hypothetical protein